MSEKKEIPAQRDARMLSREEFDQIMALPERRFTFGGIEKRGKFDETTNKFYVLDDDNKLTGKSITVTHRDRPPGEDEQRTAEDKSLADKSRGALAGALRKIAGGEKEDDAEDEVPAKKAKEAKQEDPQKGLFRKKLFFFIVAALVILLIAFVAVPKLIHNAVAPKEPAPASVQATEQTQTKKAIDMISVVQVNRDLVPGDKITENVIQEAKISAETYNQISLTGMQLYQWTRAEDLMEKDVLDFVPRGQYLTYDNIGIYHQNANPWINEQDGLVSVIVPIDFTADAKTVTNINYGSVLDLVISKQSVKESDDGASASAEPLEGTAAVQHESTVEQSYVVDTYRIAGTAVCDILNGNKVSLYRTFTSWFGIPSGEQVTYIKNLFRSSKDIYTQLTPAFIVIRMSEADAAVLGDLTGTDVTIQFSLTDNKLTDTEDRAIYVDKAASLRSNIELAMSSVLQEEAEAAKAAEEAAKKAAKEAEKEAEKS